MTVFRGRGDNVALQRFGAIVDAAPDALLALDEDGAARRQLLESESFRALLSDAALPQAA